MTATLQGHFDDTPNPPPNASISEKARYVPEVFVHHGKPHEQRKKPDKPVRNTTNTSIQQSCPCPAYGVCQLWCDALEAFNFRQAAATFEGDLGGIAAEGHARLALDTRLQSSGQEFGQQERIIHRGWES